MIIDACPHMPTIDIPHRGIPRRRWRRYPRRMPNPPEPEIIAAAAQMGVDPQALRDHLDGADLRPLDPDEPDDLPKLLARLEEP